MDAEICAAVAPLLPDLQAGQGFWRRGHVGCEGECAGGPQASHDLVSQLQHQGLIVDALPAPQVW